MHNTNEIREQLGESIQKLRPLLKTQRPVKGWLRAIREALGMSGRQLAERMDVKPPRINEMEKAETDGNITMKSLRRAAEAMDCELIYAIVPKTSLESSLRIQALKVAKRNLKSVSHTMQLENQGPTEKEDAKHLAKMTEAWIKDPPRWLWDLK